MKKLIPICLVMFAITFMSCRAMEPKEQEVCSFCWTEFNYEADELIYIDGCQCSDSKGTPIIRVYHKTCFTDFYRHKRYEGKNVSCCYCNNVLPLQEEALCYLCPEFLTKDSDSVEIYGCSCGILHRGHRNCFKKGYQYAKCNNTEIVCCSCKQELVLKAKELIVHEDFVGCSLCLKTLKDERNIIQTYGCSCWMSRVYHNTCYEDLFKNTRRCPGCNDWPSYKREVSLLQDGKQLGYEDITRKLKKNFINDVKCEVISWVGVGLLASFQFSLILSYIASAAK